VSLDPSEILYAVLVLKHLLSMLNTYFCGNLMHYHLTLKVWG